MLNLVKKTSYGLNDKEYILDNSSVVSNEIDMRSPIEVDGEEIADCISQKLNSMEGEETKMNARALKHRNKTSPISEKVRGIQKIHSENRSIPSIEEVIR